MKLTQKVTQNLIFGLCLLIVPIIYARTRQIAVQPTETILKPATVQTQATPPPVAKFKGTINDYTPAEMKAMIAQQTRDRKQSEADAKAIANGTYKEPKSIAKNEYKEPKIIPNNEDKKHVRTKPVTWEEVEEGNEIILKMRDARTVEEYVEALAERDAHLERMRKE